MTLPFVVPRIIYAGDGTTTPLPVKNGATAIRFRSNSHIKVESKVGTAAPVRLTEGIDYSLTGGPDAGLVTPLAAIPVGTSWIIWREQPVDQDVDFGIASDYSSTRSTAVADKDREIQQELAMRLANAVSWGNWGAPAGATDAILSLDSTGALQPVNIITYIDGKLGSTAWQGGGSGSGGRLWSQDSAPTSPVVGDWWWQPTAAQILFRINDSGREWWINMTPMLVGGISDGSIANVSLANMANGTIKGRISAGAGAPEDLTAAQVKTILALTPADISGVGDVTAAAAFGTDNRLLRSDGVTKGVQASGITVDDSNNVSGVQSLTLVADASSAMHATTLQQVQNLVQGLKPKGSVRFRTTANVNLAGGGLANGTSHDGVTAATGNLALVMAQSAPAENGLYIVPASGAATRATTMDSWAEVPGATVIVEEGSYADTGWLCTADQGGTLGTTAINWTQWFGTGLFQASNVLLTAIAGLSMVADRLIYGTGANTVALATITAAGRTFLAAADAAAEAALLPAFTGDSGSGGVKGLVPAPASGDAAAGRYLKADGTWSTPAGGGGGTPGGSSGQVQYNNAGAFGGVTGLTLASGVVSAVAIVGAANATPFAISGYSLTSTNTQPAIDIAATWSTTSASAILINVALSHSNATGGQRLLSIKGGASGTTEILALTSQGNASFAVFGISPNTNMVGLGVTLSSGVPQCGFVASDGNTYYLGAASTQLIQKIRNTNVDSANGGISVWGMFELTDSSFANPVRFTRRAAANLCFGAADAASPVAQTQSVQGVVAGTSNTAGVAWRRDGSVGTGTGEGGAHDFYVAPAGSSGSSQNSLVRAFRVRGNKSVIVGDSAAALATNATSGFLYVPTCAGTPTGTPVTETGAIPLVYDSTNGILYFYSGAAWVAAGGAASAASIMPYLGFGVGVA